MPVQQNAQCNAKEVSANHWPINSKSCSLQLVWKHNQANDNIFSVVYLDFHAWKQSEQLAPADLAWDSAVWAGWDVASLRYGHMGQDVAWPRIWRGDGLLPWILYLVCQRPGERSVPQNHEKVCTCHFCRFFFFFLDDLFLFELMSFFCLLPSFIQVLCKDSGKRAQEIKVRIRSPH